MAHHTPAAAHPEDAAMLHLNGIYGKFPPLSMLDCAPEITELDLGCGSGSFTAALAAKYPERKVFAADVMIGRLRKLVNRRNRMRLENLTVIRGEARYLVGRILPDRSVSRLHLLCPDPWPKLRHSGHRLLTCDFVSQIHRVLREDGFFHFSSDDAEYAAAVKKAAETSGLFVPDEKAVYDLQDIKSDFENRWLAQGKTVIHLGYRAVPRPANSPGH